MVKLADIAVIKRLQFVKKTSHPAIGVFTYDIWINQRQACGERNNCHVQYYMISEFKLTSG